MMIERRPGLTLLSHIVLVIGVLIVALPVYITFVASTHTAAEVAQVILPRHRCVQPREFPIATALLLLAQIRTEVGIVGVAIHAAGHLQEKGARGIVAVAAFLGIVGGKERAGEAQIDRRTDQPT